MSGGTTALVWSVALAIAAPVQTTAPVEAPPIETPPIETPPIETPPVETPPVETPPVETPPVETPPVETPQMHTEGGVTTVVLANGLTVMLSENHERPQVFGAVVVKTGGKNDPSDNTGMAHYLEHMLFKGTQRIGTTDWAAEAPLQAELERLYERLGTAKGEAREAIAREIGRTVAKTYAHAVPNEIDQLLEQMGGTGVNAFTTYDETVYHNTFPASQIDAWLQVYAERFVDPVFRLFPTELEAVYEEKNIAIDTTGYELFRGFMRGAFPSHPYGHNDILGEVEHLKRPSLVAMKRYFDTYYVPSNMALVLSGDFDTAAVVPRVVAHFGAWKAGEAPPPTPGTVRPFGDDEKLAMRSSPIRVGAVAYRTVPESHPDFAALQIIRGLLSNEQRSGFIDRLSDDGKVLLAMHVPADFADHNVDVVAYVPRLLTQTFRGAEQLMRRQFDRIVEGDFTEARVASIREGLQVALALEWEDNESRALAMAHAFVARGGWAGDLEYRRRLGAIDRAEVMRVAGTLFGSSRLRLRSRMGIVRKTRLDKPKTPPVKPRPGAHSVRFAELSALPAADVKIDWVEPSTALVRFELAPGVTLVTSRNPVNDVDTLQLRFGVGTDALPELDLLALYLGRVGTERHPGKQFFEALAAISTTLVATAEPDRFILELQGPRKHRDAALALAAELIDAPKLEARPLRQVRREVWGYRRIERKDAVNVGRALRDAVLYGDSSPTRIATSPGQARRTTRRELARLWRSVTERAVEVGYVGEADGAQLAASLLAHLGHAGARTAAVDAVVYPRVLPSETKVFFVPRRDAVQTQIWIAVEGGATKPEEQASADAFAEYFGGSMAGLVFQEIREFRALAYSASARYPRDLAPTQDGHLLGYVGCQADKTFDVLEVLVGLVRQMPERPDRTASVRQSLLRSQESASPGFREVQESVREWQRQGYREDPRRALRPRYEALELAEIVKFWRDHVQGRPIAIMVVGDPRKVDRDRLAEYGEVVRVRESSLYR
jgi:predicted Zn-dependent peptidase